MGLDVTQSFLQYAEKARSVGEKKPPLRKILPDSKKKTPFVARAFEIVQIAYVIKLIAFTVEEHSYS
jgi:hypothetical protein